MFQSVCLLGNLSFVDAAVSTDRGRIGMLTQANHLSSDRRGSRVRCLCTKNNSSQNIDFLQNFVVIGTTFVPDRPVNGARNIVFRPEVYKSSTRSWSFYHPSTGPPDPLNSTMKFTLVTLSALTFAALTAAQGCSEAQRFGVLTITPRNVNQGDVRSRIISAHSIRTSSHCHQ